uniref:Unannotated protein n=1 Tax=freshwater metagenome TaxID=449393 RepID=A0A6J7Q581_9ZZZZ
MIELPEVVAVQQLRVHNSLDTVLNAVAGHAERLQQFSCLVGRALRRPLLNGHLVELAHHRCESSTLGVGRASNRDPPILASRPEHAVRVVVRVCVALALPHVVVHVAVQQGGRKQVCRRLRLGEVDVLTHTGAPAVIECCEQRCHGKARRDVVGERAIRTAWRTVCPPGDPEEASHRCGHGAESGKTGQWPFLAEQAARQHDDRRVHLAQVLVVQTPRLHRLRREALGHHVGPTHEVVDHGSTLGR